MMTLEVAAERSGQSVRRIGRWCATGKLRCERDGTGWLIPATELRAIAEAAVEHENAVEEMRVTALAVPVPAPDNLADQVASRLGMETGSVSITPLSLDGVEYVVAVWRGEFAPSNGLPALRELAADLDGDLLDGEVKQG